jgi:hypothetical protein
MQDLARNLSLVFSAGALGGLANSLVVWFCGEAGITQTFGVAIAPSLTPAWLYPRIVWGAIWGGLFLIPLATRSVLWRGLLLSFGPSLVQLLVVFPLKAKKGYFGLELGTLTPIFVILFNAVWGVVTALWLRRVRAGL